MLLCHHLLPPHFPDEDNVFSLTLTVENIGSAGEGRTKSERRKGTINVKNERLEQQWKKKRELEQKSKVGQTVGNAPKAPQGEDVDAKNTDFHPSRRSRVFGGGGMLDA